MIAIASIWRGSARFDRIVGWAALVAAGLVVLLGATIAASTLWTAARAFNSVLYMDQWSLVHEVDLLLTGRYDARLLLSQHNEHRILFPRLVFFLDAWAFQGRGVSLIVLVAALQAVHGWLLWRLFVDAAAPSRPAAAALGLAAAFAFAGQQLENFTWGFQVQFVGVYLAASVAFRALARGADRGWVGHGAWCLAGAAGAVATYTMANGIVVWPLAWLMAWWLGLPRWRLLALVALGCAVGATYLWGYTSPAGHAKPLESIADLPRLLRYVAVYLGHPLAAWGTGPAANLGFGGLALTGLLALRVLLARPRVRPAEAALLAVALFALGAALVTGLGRLTFPLEQALSGRYATPANLFWLALALAALAWGARAGGGLRWLPGAALAIGLVGAEAAQQREMMASFRRQGDEREIAALALLVGVPDQAAITAIYPWPRDPLRLVPMVRRHGLAMFAGGRQDWIDTPLAERFRLAAGPSCQGSFDIVRPVEGDSGVQVRGWAWDTGAAAPAATVVIVGPDSRIVGLASGNMPRADGPAAPGLPRRAAVSWVGYARAARGPLEAWALVGGDGAIACRLEGRRDLVQNIDDRATPIDAVAVEMAGGWSRDGQSPAAPVAPDVGPVFGSWSGADANTGVIRIGPLAAAPGRALIVPAVTGPTPAGLSVRLKDADTDAVVAEWRPLPRSDRRWIAWRVDPPGGVWPARLVLEAEDAGRAWGAWLAVAWPRWSPPAP